MKISELALVGKDRLSSAQIQCADPFLHMKQILQHVLKSDSSELLVNWNETLTQKNIDEVNAILARRCNGEPFQYIVGFEGFWNHIFKVGDGVLIPRKETERLVETILSLNLPDDLRAGELGAGSGNIGISLLSERPQWVWHAFEKNPKSIPFLRENRKLISEASAYQIHEADFFEEVHRHGPYHLMVANPPYIPQRELASLPLEVKHEPNMALDGGDYGLEIIEKFVPLSWDLLENEGVLALEIDSRHGENVKSLCLSVGFDKVQVLQDYARLDRIVIARKEIC